MNIVDPSKIYRTPDEGFLHIAKGHHYLGKVKLTNEGTGLKYRCYYLDSDSYKNFTAKSRIQLIKTRDKIYRACSSTIDDKSSKMRMELSKQTRKKLSNKMIKALNEKNFKAAKRAVLKGAPINGPIFWRDGKFFLKEQNPKKITRNINKLQEYKMPVALHALRLKEIKVKENWENFYKFLIKDKANLFLKGYLIVYEQTKLIKKGSRKNKQNSTTITFTKSVRSKFRISNDKLEKD
jgi:hypothetical protein